MIELLRSTMDMVKKDIDYQAEKPGQDIWQTYLESVENGGDCEDSALAMREVLLIKGFTDHRIHLVAGKLKRRGEMHMVLLIDQFVLDILERKPQSAVNYFHRTMNKTYMLSFTGLYVNGVKWMERDQDPRWKRYTDQLRSERS